MKSSIQDLIGIVMSLGVLFVVAQNTLKKGVNLYKYWLKISKAIKTDAKRQHAVSAEPSHPPPALNKRQKWMYLAWGFVFVAILCWLIIGRTGSPTRIEVLLIAGDMAAILFLGMGYVVEGVIDNMGRVIESLALLSAIDKAIIERL